MNPVKKIGEMELAWAAGFYDGEGNCCYNKTSGVIVLSVAQSDLEALERFQEAVGFGHLFGPYIDGFGKKPKHKIQISSQVEVFAVIEKLYPLLCSPKKWQIDDAVEAFHNRDMRYIAAGRKRRRKAQKARELTNA